jgi:hypothetical protein
MWSVLGVSWPHLGGRNWSEFTIRLNTVSVYISGSSVQVTEPFIAVRILAGNEGSGCVLH